MGKSNWRQKLTLSVFSVGRRLLKNTPLESSPLIHWIHRRIFRLGFSEQLSEINFVLRGSSFTVSGQDSSMLPGLLNGTYETHELNFFLRTIRPGWTVFDVGANFGLYSKLASAAVGAAGHVYAFEPVPATLAFLQRNTANTPNVTIIPLAVSSHVGETEISVAGELGCSSLLSRNGDLIRVSVTTLDETIRSLGIQRVDFIKMDIEGFEEEALRGMPELMKSKPIIMLEFNPTFLKAHGRDPGAFFQWLVANFGAIHYIHEASGKLLPIQSPRDLGRQIIGNLVLNLSP